jgi:outer membrane protein OmpA-like peptidoglycan-associated protein
MSNLLNQLKQLAGNEIISAASKSLGENEQSVSKALGAIFPSLLQGVMNTPSASHEAVGHLFSAAANDHNMSDDVLQAMHSGQANNSAMGLGGQLISTLFGDKLAGLSNLISNFSGIKSGSSNSLLQLGGSLIASFLGKKMLSEGLNFSSLLGWLGEHKSGLLAGLPEGFGSFLGASAGATNAAKSSAGAAHTMMNDQQNGQGGGGSKWILPIILLGLLGAFAWYWLKGSKSEKPEETSSEQVATTEPGKDSLSVASVDSVPPSSSFGKGKMNESGDWIVEKGAAKTIKLDNGVELASSEGGFEDLLLNFIKDPSASINQEKGDWFNFEDLLFESNKSKLKPGGEKQLRNMVEILSAYPNLKIKIGGYTDNTGDSLANNKLSDARAKTVYNELLKLGKSTDLKRPVDASQFDEKHPYEGYGSLWPVADNSTPEGRAQNRRIAVRVKAK